MYKLREAGQNSYILNIIDQYLRNKTVHIEIDENRSGVFSPVSFIFYIGDMFLRCKGKTEMYVACASHVSAGDLMEEFLSHLLKDFDESTEWIGKWCFKISWPITEVVIFSSIFTEIRESAKNIELRGSTIKIAKCQQRSISQ